MAAIQCDGFSDLDLEAFRRWQRVSYDVLAEVAAQVVPGVTERDATRCAVGANSAHASAAAEPHVEGTGRHVVA